MTSTIDRPTQTSTIAEQAPKLIAHIAGYVAHRTISMGLRQGLIRGFADAPGSSADDLAAARRRRMGTGSGADEELALGEDAIEMVADEESATETTMEITASPDDSSLGAEQPVEAYLDDTAPSRDTADAAPADTEDSTDGSGPAAEPKVKPAKKRGRASVPSWDEIMFGGGKND